MKKIIYLLICFITLSCGQKRNEPQEIIKMLEQSAIQLNKQCPFHPDEWTTIQAVFMNGKTFTQKMIVDDSVIDDFSPITYKENIIADFASQKSSTEIKMFGERLLNAGVTMTHLIYTRERGLVYSIDFTGSDYISYRSQEVK